MKIACLILPSFLPLFKLKFFIVYDFIVFYENSWLSMFIIICMFALYTMQLFDNLGYLFYCLPKMSILVFLYMMI